MRPLARLRTLALLSLSVLAASFGVPGAARADIVYVLNSGDATISLLDAATRKEIRRVRVLREVHHLVLTPDRSELMVGDSMANEMLFFDPPTGEIRRRMRISNPYHLEFSPDGRHLVITSLRRNQVDIYGWDGSEPTLLSRLRMPEMPSHLAYSPDGGTVYVTLQGTGRLAAIDLETREPLWQLDVGPEPAGVIWHRGRLIVGVMGTDHFVVVNPATREIEGRIAIGRGAHAIFPSPDGSALYATSRVDSRIARVDPDTLAVVARWDIPGGPDCIAFDPEGRIWVTLRWVQRVAVVDPETGRFETIRVGRSPHGIFVQPRRGADGPPPQPAASAAESQG